MPLSIGAMHSWPVSAFYWGLVSLFTAQAEAKGQEHIYNDGQEHLIY
jgi:hypothetical protein